MPILAYATPAIILAYFFLDSFTKEYLGPRYRVRLRWVIASFLIWIVTSFFCWIAFRLMMGSTFWPIINDIFLVNRAVEPLVIAISILLPAIWKWRMCPMPFSTSSWWEFSIVAVVVLEAIVALVLTLMRWLPEVFDPYGGPTGVLIRSSGFLSISSLLTFGFLGMALWYGHFNRIWGVSFNPLLATVHWTAAFAAIFTASAVQAVVQIGTELQLPALLEQVAAGLPAITQATTMVAMLTVAGGGAFFVVWLEALYRRSRAETQPEPSSDATAMARGYGAAIFLGIAALNIADLFVVWALIR